MMLADAGFSMPVWSQVVVAAAALSGAIVYLWTKVLHPAAKLITTTEVMVPLLVELTDAFRDQPKSFRILSDIAAQFRSDSGSSLRDVINRLELAAIENHRASEALKVGVELSRVLAERDREAVQRLIVLLDRLSIRAQRLEESRARVAADLAVAQKTVDEVAATRADVAADLVTAQQKVVEVAADLAAAHLAADEAPDDPGAAADAASRTLWDGLERRVADAADYNGPERRDPPTH